MEAIIDSVLDLIGQLIRIGSTEPIVMIAGAAILICIVLAIASVACALIVSIPLIVGNTLIKLVSFVFRLILGRTREYEDQSAEEDLYREDESESDSDQDQEIAVVHDEPRYPEWMKQKSGRLL